MNQKNKTNSPSILLFGKKNDEHCEKALAFLSNNFQNLTIYIGSRGEPLPNEVLSWSGDYIISYLAPWIIPDNLLQKAKAAAFNFHPASPDYPGIGCTNFALYNEAQTYGATCHHMLAKVDTGKIIATKIFPVLSTDTIDSLLKRTYDYQLILFYEVMDYIIQGKPLPESTEQWSRKPYKRTELDALSVINPNLSEQELRKRIRATSFKAFQPHIEIAGYKFTLETKDTANY